MNNKICILVYLYIHFNILIFDKSMNRFGKFDVIFIGIYLIRINYNSRVVNGFPNLIECCFNFY